MTWPIILFAIALSWQQPQHHHVGEIALFGTDGINVQKLQSALPVTKGEELTDDQIPELFERIKSTVDSALGHKPTDVTMVCCNNRGEDIVYIGLGGRNTVTIPFVAAPKGRTCLSEDALRLYKAEMEAWVEAFRKGKPSEDDSQGYALLSDSTLRDNELAARKYAVAHQQRVEQVLQSCARPEDRQAAAWILGYALKSRKQIAAQVRASRDEDETVRNNAVRALSVLATSSSRTASEIPPDSFIELLNSGVWSDRNKAGWLLVILSSNRNPKLLQQLKSTALPSLIEMAKWDSGHAEAYRMLLGRIAGLEDAQIHQLIDSGKVNEILAAVGTAP
jgi:hypothetical protein